MATNKESLIVRLRAACNGLPGAVIAWPHRILHEAAEELAAANARIADLEARLATAEGEVVRLREPWQPIETAPKDGTRVLLWRRAIRDQPTPIMADGFWCETYWVWPYLLSEPTHWQPLLAPPNNPQ